MSQVLHDHVNGQTNGHASPRNPPGRRYGKPATTTDPAGLSAWAASILPVVENLRTLAEDATAVPTQRVHSRLVGTYGCGGGVDPDAARPQPALPPPWALAELAGAGGPLAR